MAMSLAEEVLLCVGCAIIFITNIVGNLLVCAIVFKTKNLQNFTSILIVNMAVGDLLVGLVGIIHIILEVCFLIGGINEYSLLCGRLNGIVLFSASTSIYTMAVLAYDRYLTIVKPIIRRSKLTKGKLKIILPVIWALSLAFVGPCLYFIEIYDFEDEKLICWETLPQDELPLFYRITLFVIMYFIPMCITIYFFGKIFIRLWTSKQHQVRPSTSQVLLKSRKHVTRILGSVILLFNICWLPWFTVELLSSLRWIVRSEVLQSGLALLAVAHSSMNPFIYAFQSENFRRHIRQIKKRRKVQVDGQKKKLSKEAFITMHAQYNGAENQGSFNLVQLPRA